MSAEELEVPARCAKHPNGELVTEGGAVYCADCVFWMEERVWHPLTAFEVGRSPAPLEPELGPELITTDHPDKYGPDIVNGAPRSRVA